MSEQFLDGADVVPALEQMGGKAVAKGMATGRLTQAGRADRELNGVLQVLFRGVVASDFTAPRVGGETGGGKDILPA